MRMERVEDLLDRERHRGAWWGAGAMLNLGSLLGAAEGRFPAVWMVLGLLGLLGCLWQISRRAS